nr:MAG TPA: helix-turn-helix domain protein [Caudoviricetes sp.]
MYYSLDKEVKDLSTFGERLKNERERQGYNQKQFAALLGVTPTRLNYWEKDKREPDVFNIRNILQVLGIDSDYLLGIERENKNSPVPAKAETGELNTQEQTLIHNYRALNDEGQEKLFDYSEDLVSSGRYTKNNQPEISQEA